MILRAVRRSRRTRWERFKRLLRYRLIVPLKRSHHHAPEYTARGVLVGLAWALTPTIGIQMGLSLVTWIVARRLFRWDFNLIVACAWTWTTNVVTMLPCYYVFYVTGQLMLGHFDDLSGYREFLGLWQSHVGAEEAVERLARRLDERFQEFVANLDERLGEILPRTGRGRMTVTSTTIEGDATTLDSAQLSQLVAGVMAHNVLFDPSASKHTGPTRPLTQLLSGGEREDADS